MKNEFALRHSKLRMLIGHHCKGPADRWKGKYNQRHEFRSGIKYILVSSEDYVFNETKSDAFIVVLLQTKSS